MASAASSIAAAEARLQSAYFGLDDMEKRPERFHSGLMNAVVFARMVTLSLQNMRNDVAGWQEWYAVEQEKMRADESMKFFVDLRNAIEKTASQPVAMSAYISSFSSSDMAKFQPAPPGATSFVIGHSGYGGASGWEVARESGEIDFYAVEMPEAIAKTTMHFIDAPEHLNNRDAREVVRAHLGKLGDLVRAAKSQFITG